VLKQTSFANMATPTRLDLAHRPDTFIGSHLHRYAMKLGVRYRAKSLWNMANDGHNATGERG